MEEWLSSMGRHPFRRFDFSDMVSPDGVPVKLVLNFVKREDRESALPALRAEARTYPRLNFRFADPSLFRAFLGHFNYSASSTRLCFLASFIEIGYTECPTLVPFSENRAVLRTVPTPRDIYAFAVDVNEEGFFELLRRGPLFATFDRAGCQACGDRAESARQAAVQTAKFGSRAAWCVWDTATAYPSFLQALQLPIPSLWYFPTENLSEAIFYGGNADPASVVKWVHAQVADFALDAALAHQEPVIRL